MRGALALSTLGRSITAGVMSGAVTMKITSSTSITSMYGTTLISCIGPRLRRAGIKFGDGALIPYPWRRSPGLRELGLRPRSSLDRLAMQDVRELLHEALEAVAQPLDVVGVAVVGHHRRDRGEEADRGGDQRLGDAGRDLRERR